MKRTTAAAAKALLHRIRLRLCNSDAAFSKAHSLYLAGCLASCMCLLLAAQPVKATVLTFDSFVFNEDVDQNYGDNVISDTQNGFTYAKTEDGGWTPNIVVEYSVVAPGTEGNDSFEVFDGFGNLGKALGDETFDMTGEIVLIPEQGYRVHLNSFLVAAFNSLDPSDATGQIEIFNELGSAEPVVTYSGTFAQNNTTGQDDQLGWDTFTPNITSDLAIRIRSPNFGTLGIDNINFDQSVVPEPSTIALWSIAGLVCGYLAWRRRWG